MTGLISLNKHYHYIKFNIQLQMLSVKSRTKVTSSLSYRSETKRMSLETRRCFATIGYNTERGEVASH